MKNVNQRNIRLTTANVGTMRNKNVTFKGKM